MCTTRFEAHTRTRDYLAWDRNREPLTALIEAPGDAVHERMARGNEVTLHVSDGRPRVLRDLHRRGRDESPFRRHGQ